MKKEKSIEVREQRCLFLKGINSASVFIQTERKDAEEKYVFLTCSRD